MSGRQTLEDTGLEPGYWQTFKLCSAYLDITAL